MLKQLCIVVLLFGQLSGCSSIPETNEPLRLRVLTYNIKHGRGQDNTFNYQRLADVIKGTKPDLVALQEVDVKTGRSSGVDQPARLGELTGMHHHFAEAMPFSGGSYGEALLIRNNLLRDIVPGWTPLALLAGPDQEPRAVVIGELDLDGFNGSTLIAAGTHLSHESGQTRLSQVQQINQAMLENPEKPIILAGDFNFTPDSKPYQAMIDAGWIDTAAAFGDPKPTYPSETPRTRIDYVFVRPANAWGVIDVTVIHEPLASDHAPVLVELEYVQP